MIAGGLPVRKIAESVSPAIHFTQIQRYKQQQMRPAPATKPANPITVNAIQRSATTATPETISPSPARSPLRDRVEKVYQRIERALDTSEAATDAATDAAEAVNSLKAIAPLFKAATAHLRLEGELTGELTAAPSTVVNISIVTQAAPAAHQPYDLEIVPGDGDIGLDGVG